MCPIPQSIGPLQTPPRYLQGSLRRAPSATFFPTPNLACSPFTPARTEGRGTTSLPISPVIVKQIVNQDWSTHSLGIEGYIYASEPAGFTDSVQLYRCFRPSPFDHLVTTIPPVTVNGQQRCGEDPTGYTYEGSLGWIVAVSPPANTPEVPNVLILPALALGLIGTATWVRRRRMAAKCVELR